MLQASLRRARPAQMVHRGLILSSSRKAAVKGSAAEGVAAAQQAKGYATAVSSQPLHSTPAPEAAAKAAKLPGLSSIEASWVSLPRDEQEKLYSELHELQKKDWNELSIDEKKAAYYIAYGPHGPRAPIVPPNTNGKVFLGVLGCLGATIAIFATVRSFAQETPKTMSKEWKQAQDEYAREQKMDPFTGVSRADGKGKSYTSG